MPCHDRGLRCLGDIPVTRTTLILRYSSFAVVATIANLATQRLVLVIGDTLGIVALAIAMGTLVGLMLKYILDKRWIFHDTSSGLQAHSKKFMLYTVMGLITTAIFWGTELTFWLVWKTDTMRELGAILGLGVGYIIKYNLDRKFVFTDSHMRAMS